MITITRTNSDNDHFRELVALLDEDLHIRDGEDHSFYAQFNTIDKINHVVIAYKDGHAAGCGAFREYSAASVEIKRMFVKPAYRGRGIASLILTELEIWAGQLNNSACVLETGKNQPEAIGLYQKRGYRIIPNYGQYAGIANSVCMQKEI